MTPRQPFYTEIKPWPFSRRVKQLTINSDIIKYASSGLMGDSAFTFAADEITEFRCGIKWLKSPLLIVFGDMQVVMGREYQVFVRNKSKEEMAIRFKTIYGFRKKQLNVQFENIMNALWDNFFSDMVGRYLGTFYAGKGFELAGVEFSSSGLTIKIGGLLKEEQHFIPWSQAAIKTYNTYFSIYNLEDPERINHGYNYHTDWNTHVLRAVVKYIIDQPRKSPGKD